ncbi:hypothetical protein R83H12_02229 [Fibrobacteria bacterium R8-3-H12]
MYDYYGEYESRGPGWYDRGKGGFYWTSNGSNIFTLMWAEGGGSFFWQDVAMDIEYFSVRCIANDDFKISCGTGSYIPATQFCSGGEIYAKCSGKEYNPAVYECDGTDQ